MASTMSAPHQIRDRLTAVVQWQPARNSLKYGAHFGARVRGKVLTARGTMPTVNNIYAGSCPKSGSQWAKALLHHPIVRAHTGLFTLPQLAYYQQEPKAFPVGTFVPGMYVSYDYYRQIPHTGERRMIYIFRDPRDIVVSAWFSGTETHREIFNVAAQRQMLLNISMDEGMTYIIKNGETHLRNMATWVDLDDESVMTIRLEDIGADHPNAVRRILAHCGVELSEDEMATVVFETSREEMQRRDLENRPEGVESHYRVRRQGFRELLKPEHYAAIDALLPGFIEKMNYPPA